MRKILPLFIGSIVALIMFAVMALGSYLLAGTDFIFFAVVAVIGGALAVGAGGAINYWTR